MILLFYTQDNFIDLNMGISPLNLVSVMLLTHYGLVTPFTVTDFGYYWVNDFDFNKIPN